MSAFPIVIVMAPDGRNSAVVDGIEATPGRPARDFARHARATAATGVWSA